MKFAFYRDVLSLMMVMQGRPRVSSCKLLQLPAEILADIVDLLSDDRASLESLALVNSDCQQLARCCQFAEVNFDYSLEAKQLASQLVEDKSSQLSKPGIGACIRRVTFASHPHHVAHTHRELYESFYGDDAQSVAVEQREVLSDEAREEYVVARAAAVEAISSLPNLETLSWRDQFSLDKSFFERITRCSAQHIDLNRPAIDDAWSLTPPLTPSTWPLRSLKLDVTPLKSLDLDDRVLNNPSTFDCKPLRDLEDFAVSHPPQKASACKRIAKFISQHTGLRRLYLHESSSAQGGTAYLDDVILPTLSSLDFGNLRSLYLAWGEAQIPEKSLRRIGRLVSLEQLSLSAGKPSGWQHQWLVDHDELRQHLRQLQGLTKLALVRDTCPVPVPYPGLPSETYYKMLFAGSEEREDAEARPDLDMDQDTESDAQEGEGLLRDMEEIWERAHRNRMLDQAEKYAAVFPKLEWMFCGQRPMGFMKTPEGQCEFRRAVPLTQGRDECRTYRQAIFRGSY
uniref:F-box domain-containing protein n=1 Tax=Fusarium oxysporum (strain Fo5176) TaxID=660025 RepID=A0A0D2XTZ6_FUSOF